MQRGSGEVEPSFSTLLKYSQREQKAILEELGFFRFLSVY